ncbi:MAE_28990/MAE_18760 family HEPN-like nuclease [Sphingomonas albertensis]|uniref:RiboL-PSP-HEPN domain-containing protein n=1 Tax=Sphingomonas albertensis TaxID=2762591 RepID=A0ABR7ARF1_9SPHN|nr:MAE_28990/MAE_18760 family HEPN-like nuclease [Sphingomonas albertensis]MBC3943044.1 hypothetical protein [Sphingomonas albertensis]
MSKPYSENELYDQLASDRTWRVKEISDLKNAIRTADTAGQRVLLRSLVAIAYAHWEGHIRYSSYKYLLHISLRKLPLASLEKQFLKNFFYSQFNSQAHSSLKAKGELIDKIMSSDAIRYARVNEDLINTKSNLNFETFSEICAVCGLDPGSFAEEENFVDVILLKRRNAIAHGEETFVDLDDLDDLSDRTIKLMRRFSDDLSNRATLKSYLVSAV